MIDPPTDPATDQPTSARTVGLVAAASCFALVTFFGDGLPFYFEDSEIIDVSLKRPWVQLLSELVDPRHVGDRIGYQAQGRPLGLLFLKAAHALVGWRAWLIRAPEVLALAATAGLVAAAIARSTRAPRVAASLGISLGVAPSLQQSALWICDFEPLAAFLAATALLLWSRELASSAERRRWPRLILIVGITLLGVKAKPGAFVVAPVLVLSSLLCRRRLLPQAMAAAAVLVLVVVPPRLAGLGEPGVSPGLWSNVLHFGPMSLRTCAVGWVGVLALLIVLLRARPDPSDRPLGSVHALAATLAAWGLCAAGFWVLLPAAEGRYLAGFALPALASAHLAAALLVRRFGAVRRGAVVAALLLGFATLLPANLVRDAAFRGSWGSVFIALDQAGRALEERSTATAVVYRYWRPMLYRQSPASKVEFLWQDKAEAERHGIEFGPDGRARFPDRFVSVVRLRLAAERPDTSPSEHRYPGRSGLWFDRLVAHTGWRIRNLDLVDLTTNDEGGPYPLTAFVEPW